MMGKGGERVGSWFVVVRRKEDRELCGVFFQRGSRVNYIQRGLRARRLQGRKKGVAKVKEMKGRIGF